MRPNPTTLANGSGEDSGGDGADLVLRRWLLVATAAVGLVWLVVLALWDEAPFALTFDDAYYYFGIARNLAEGEGSTFDGLNATNGYHPLWLVLAVPVYWMGFDDLAAVRALLVAQLLAYLVALAVVARAVSELVGDWARIRRTSRADHDAAIHQARIGTTVAFVVLAVSPFTLKLFVNGLESGLAVMVWAVVLCRFATSTGPLVDARTPRWRAVTGLLLFVAFLVRTDAVLLVGCLGLWLIAELRVHGVQRHRVQAVAEYLAPTAVGVVAFVAFNQVVFGIPIQISGIIKRASLDVVAVTIVVVAAALALVAGRRAFRRGQREESRPRGRLPLTGALMGRIGWFAAGCVLLVGYYQGLQTQQWLWYYAPIGVLGVITLPLVLADLSSAAVTESRRDQSVASAVVPIQAILLVPLAGFGLYQATSFVDPEVRSIQLANREAGVWIDQNLPRDAVLSSWDAGVVGYFAHRPVVNLDGVVNSEEFHQAQLDGRVGDFLDDDEVGWVVNHGTATDGDDRSVLEAVSRWWSPEVADATQLEKTWPFTFSGVIAGSEGLQSSNGEMEVFLYELPPVDER